MTYLAEGGGAEHSSNPQSLGIGHHRRWVRDSLFHRS